MEAKNKFWNSYVNWAIFIPIIGLLFTVISFTFYQSVSAKDMATDAKIKTDNTGTDISWIKTTLTEMKDDIKDIKK
jgi:hypothetical protein